MGTVEKSIYGPLIVEFDIQGILSQNFGNFSKLDGISIRNRIHVDAPHDIILTYREDETQELEIQNSV